MKLKITYDKINDNYCFNYNDGALKVFNLLNTFEELNIQARMSCSTCERLLIDCSCNDKLIEIEV